MAITAAPAPFRIWPQRVLIAGASEWSEPGQVHDALTDVWHDIVSLYGPEARMIVMHADEETGAVAAARDWAHAHGIPDEPHAVNGLYRPGAPISRVRSMVDHADFVLAFLAPGDHRAKATALLAGRAGRPVRRIEAP
ncbi:SLOG family protein [Streptomyces sp. NPDC059679]|uniref:SLOG family protein n=1 Tax=Streptomyces sp. NPDC059679 TaxID=3346903 RepID=UPI0036C9CFDA